MRVPVLALFLAPALVLAATAVADAAEERTRVHHDVTVRLGSNAETMARLCAMGDVRVGGGIRDLETARRWLDAGARWIILGTAATLSFVTGQVVQAICIFAVLILGYALDCADGMIARAHGQSSLFGAIFDKVSDLLAITICMALLAGAAFDDSPWSGIVTVSLFGTGMACRLALVLAVWLKEFVGSPPNRGVPDSRERTLDWHLRRAIGEQSLFGVIEAFIRGQVPTSSLVVGGLPGIFSTSVNVRWPPSRPCWPPA